MVNFFTGLRWELAFYLGCAKLHQTLAEAGWPTTYPTPLSARSRRLEADELYDAGLCLRAKTGLVGNDLHAEDKDLLLITGANQGGKSTFLRALGVAQLMTQCGMFVTARSLSASVTGGIYTHYRREEDERLIHGKFDEELSRLSEIVDDLPADAMVLFNESFASTNEREGSEIARQVIGGLRDSGVRVLFVTHLHDLAHGLYAENDPAALFLRAERAEDGTRTYRIVEGEPLATSYGPDLYAEVFGASAETQITPPPDHGA
jgi:DNA mismatch repair ATPase MutS